MTGLLIHGVFRLTPRRYRFKVARVLATLAGSGAERRLGYFLAGMDARGLPFDPDVEVSGFEQLRAAQEAGQGVVMIGTHANSGMARLLLRALDDARVPFVATSHAPGYPICGTGREVETIRPSGAFLVAVRSKLRSGSVVCALLDSPEPMARDAAHVVIDGASLWLATPLVRMAIQWQVPIFFMKGQFTGRSIVVELQPSPAAVNTDEVIEAFAAFLPVRALRRRAASAATPRVIADSVPASPPAPAA